MKVGIDRTKMHRVTVQLLQNKSMMSAVVNYLLSFWIVPRENEWTEIIVKFALNSSNRVLEYTSKTVI